MKKNIPKIHECNLLLKKKLAKSISLEDLANFIGFIVNKDKPKPIINNIQSQLVTIQITNKSAQMDNTSETLDNTSGHTANNMPDNEVDNIIQLETVDNWEDL